MVTDEGMLEGQNKKNVSRHSIERVFAIISESGGRSRPALRGDMP